MVGLNTLALGLSACGQKEVPKPQSPPVDTAAPKREDDFKWKDRCAIAADRIDKHFKDDVSEVFYSTKRNSCMCEVVSLQKGDSFHELYDCLTAEERS